MDSPVSSVVTSTTHYPSVHVSPAPWTCRTRLLVLRPDSILFCHSEPGSWFIGTLLWRSISVDLPHWTVNYRSVGRMLAFRKEIRQMSAEIRWWSVAEVPHVTLYASGGEKWYLSKEAKWSQVHFRERGEPSRKKQDGMERDRAGVHLGGWSYSLE